MTATKCNEFPRSWHTPTPPPPPLCQYLQWVSASSTSQRFLKVYLLGWYAFGSKPADASIGVMMRWLTMHMEKLCLSRVRTQSSNACRGLCEALLLYFDCTSCQPAIQLPLTPALFRWQQCQTLLPGSLA